MSAIEWRATSFSLSSCAWMFQWAADRSKTLFVPMLSFPEVALNPSESRTTEFESSSHPFKYHVCAYLRLIFGLRYLGHHLRPISSRTQEIRNLLLTHANTIQHHSLGCCYNHIQSIPINRLNRSLRPFILQWIDSPTPHLSNWAPGPGIGKKIDKRMMEGTESQKPFCTSNCCCTWSSSPASWEQVLLLFSSLQLVQLSSLELPYWDRSPATLVVLTCKILLVRGIWETTNGSSYCSFMFTFVWVDNGQPENWHNTSKAPTCHQKNKSFKKCRSFFGSFASLVSFVSFTSFTSFVSLASFTSFTSSAGSALRMAWVVCYDMPATSSNPSWSGGFPEKWRKKQHPSWEYGEAIHQGNCTWRSSMQLPCIGFY